MTFKCLPFEALSLTDLYEVMALRQAVFVLEQNCPYLDADGKDLKSHHLLCSDNNELVAYARLLPEGVSYDGYVSIGRVLSARGVRGSGIGRLLVQEAIRQSGRLFGPVPIKISAQSYLLTFYASFGFEPIGEEYMEDDIPHTAMLFRWPSR
jgi:ElaA protein